MSFFDPDNLRAVTSGRWVRRPEGHTATIGVGIDTREELSGRAFVAIRGETHDGHEYLRAAKDGGATLAIVEREHMPAALPEGLGILAVDDTRRALAQLARGHRRSLPGTKVIAITGSCGKTTTKRLVHAVLSTALPGTAAPKSFNNDIGVPLTLLGMRPRDRYVIVEIGTNAPGEIAALARLAEPDIAVITSIGRAHLAGFGTVDAIAREKASLLAHLAPGGVAVLNAEAALPVNAERAAESVVRYGEAEDADFRLTDRGRDPSWWFEVNGRFRFDLALPGRHNAVNALAAIAIGRRFGLDDGQMSRALGGVEPEPMRMAVERIPVVGAEGHIDLYNDAYNANPESMIAALETFIEAAVDAPRRVVVLGDMLELGDEGPALHAEIGLHLIDVDCRRRIEHAVFIGSLSKHMARAVRRVWPETRCTVLAELDEAAAETVASGLRPGDAVLLKASRGLGLERLAEALRPGACALETQTG